MCAHAIHTRTHVYTHAIQTCMLDGTRGERGDPLAAQNRARKGGRRACAEERERRNEECIESVG